MHDICAILGHSPHMFGICSVCGVQTPVWPVPVKPASLEEMKYLDFIQPLPIPEATRLAGVGRAADQEGEGR